MGNDLPGTEDRGLRVGSSLARLAGLGITAAGGSLGPVLTGVGGILGNVVDRRGQQRLALELPEGSDERRVADLLAQGRDLTPGAFAGLRRDQRTRQVGDLLPRVLGEVEDRERIPQPPETVSAADRMDTMAVGPYTVERPEEERLFRRRAREPEALARIADPTFLPDTDPAVRSALTREILQRNLGYDRQVPKDVARERDEGRAARAIMGGEQGVTPERAWEVARSGAEPSYRDLVPRPMTPYERFVARREQRGLERDERMTGETIPALRQQAERLRGMKGVIPADMEALESALRLAEDDPTPRNLAMVQDAIKALPKAITGRAQFAERQAALTQRVQERTQAAQKAVADKNLGRAEANVKFIVRDLDAEMTRLRREVEWADETTRQQMLARMDELERNKNTYLAWLDEVTGLRAVTPGQDVERPDYRIPPRGGRAPAGGGGSPATDAERQGWRDEGLVR